MIEKLVPLFKKSIAINIWSPKWYHNGILKLIIPSLDVHDIYLLEMKEGGKK